MFVKSPGDEGLTSPVSIALASEPRERESCRQESPQPFLRRWSWKLREQILRGRCYDPLVRYGLATISVIFCLVLRESLTPLIVDQDPFMFFAPAVILSCAVGGLGPGLFAWFCGLALGDFIFSGPRYAFGPFGPAQITLMCTYSFTSVTAVALIQALIRLKQKAEKYSQTLEAEIVRRRKAEEQLQSAQETLRSYAENLELKVQQRTVDLQATVSHLEGVLYHMAHDLRSPLRAMAGYASLIEAHYKPGSDCSEHDWPEIISKAAIRMDALLQDLLAYGKVGHADFPCSKVDLAVPLSEAMARLGSIIESTGADISIQTPLHSVWANGAGLTEVFFQLLGNSLKFTTPKTSPAIRVWTELQDGKTCIWIADNGIGFPSQHAERIFQVFEKLQGADYAGHGIGLAVVRKVIARMHGEVGGISNEGEGSRFWIKLPERAP